MMYKIDRRKQIIKNLAVPHANLFTKLLLPFFDLLANKENLFHPDVLQ